MIQGFQDIQKDLMIRFIGAYQNLKKENKERRTDVRLQQYETERIIVSNKIKENNKELVKADAPQDYLDEFEEFETINEKFVKKLKEFYLALGINYSPMGEPHAETTDNINSIQENSDIHKQLKEAEKRVAELERHLLLQQTIHNPPNETINEIKKTTKMEKIDELLEMLVKSQIQQTNNIQQPRQRSGDTMVDVPMFVGDVSEYKAFKQIFIQVVSSQNWTPIEQFLKLRSKFQGSPKEAISSLYIEEGSYEIAWEILDRNYLNPRQLLEHDILRITNSKYIIKGQDAKSHIDSKNTFVNIAANVKQLKLTAIDILVQFTILKMDNVVRGRFEDFLGGSQELPTEDKIITFLEKETQIYQNIQNHIHQKDSKLINKCRENIKTIHSHITTESSKLVNEIKCFICGLSHTVLECATFLASDNREGLLRFHKICIYCTKHRYNRNRPCNSRKHLKCDKCDEKHINEMHPMEHKSRVANEKESSKNFLTNTKNASCTVLPTAVANIVGQNGLLAPIRCLIGLGSESSYICAHVVQSLGLRKYKTSIKIKGISGKHQYTTSSYVNLRIKMNDPALEIVTTKAYVLPAIADSLPSSKIKINSAMTDLADPYFNTPALVGVLLGSDVASKIFRTDISSKITEDGWLMQPTHLGWIVCGRGEEDTSRSELSTFVTFHESMMRANNDVELNKKILEFYEIPEDTNSENQSNIEYCEKLYKDNHYRDADGRYVVPTPWRPDAPQLGNSFRRAVKLFLKQEKMWKNNSEHYQKSNEFMEEYLRMGHMTEVINLKEKFRDDGNTHYLAYISILRKDAVTTKLRNVFHASLPSSNGISLNDTMYQGKKLQTDIFNILTKSRSFKFFFSADIEKMFRQINIIPKDRDRMRIIWRSNSSEPLREFRLNTVTYGTDAAPWQAIRTIHQCATDNSSDQIITQIIKKGFYVDDLMYGADSITECQELIQKITFTMGRGKFPLTKWVSNHDEVLQGIPSNKRLSYFIPEKTTLVKILGILYDHETDEFCINVKNHDNIEFTKRGFSRIAASVYDPLGFILPVTMRSRLYVQKLWKQKYDWDDKLPENMITEFMLWYKDLEFLRDIKYSRWLNIDGDGEIELIGFSDASGVAKAAVIYSRVKKAGKYHINFVAAKGNVNKLNSSLIIKSQQNTVPKNELDAVVILVDLLMKVGTSLDMRNVTFRAYTDSKVALSWIRNSSQNDNKYIRRRVEKIKNHMDPYAIHYVKSAENPADPASRGLSAEQLQNCSLWINGPTWLSDPHLPKTPFIEKFITQNFYTQTNEENIFERISKFTTLIRVIVFMSRWKYYKRDPKTVKKSTNNYHHEPITATEVIQAKVLALKYFQQQYFRDDIEKLNKKIPINKKNWLYKLSPFIDDRGLVRVGGRLNNANVDENQKHPIIIPPGLITEMLIECTHTSNMHAGNTLTIQKLIDEYYIRGIKRNMYHVINKCTKCLRWKAKVIQPEMSQLPRERVVEGGVFEKVGVDLAGPVLIKASNLRTNKIVKVWIAVFVCLVTKAAHLEIVSSLTTEDFLAALTRLICRRGPIKEIWSDNGTNFQGANRKMKEAWKIIVDESTDNISIQEIKWQFIPRHSPTFGGLWEACVKSMKYFIKRMGSTTNLTYEQFYTLICRIESLLNSRPLIPNPIEPTDTLSLTPFHFITSRGLKLLSTEAINENKSPLTKKWLTILQIQRQFWDKFRTEYLYSLQKRQKWLEQQPNLCVGDVVLIKEPNVTPGDWKMGKVSKVYPDPEGIVRKVDVKDSLHKEKLQAVNQLVPLMQEDKPVLRRSSRSNQISAVQVLITWLTLTSSTKAFNFTMLSPGVHLLHINDVYVKATDLNLTIETHVNVNQDLSTIHDISGKLQTFCAEFRSTSRVKSYCENSSEIVEFRLMQVKDQIMNIYGMTGRSRRWIGLLAKGAIRYGAAALFGAGLVYQEYEIHSLKTDNKLIQERVRKASMILLNITELEHEEIDKKLTDTIKMQQEIQIETEINSYVEMTFIA